MFGKSKIGVGLLSLMLAIGSALPAAAQYMGGGDGYGMWGGGHMLFGGLWMVLVWVLFIGLIVALAVLLVRWLGGIPGGGEHHRPSGPTPRDILEERFAKGEIDKEEFEERKKHLSK